MRPASGHGGADFARVRALFEQAIDLPEGERDGWLETRCGGDADLLREVRALVEADRESAQHSLLPVAFDRGASAAWSGALDASLAPELRIGAFTLLRRLGSGGMGDVWEAEQDQPRRRVAVKILRAGAAQGSLLARFLTEIEILARLSHPGIAQVHASGMHVFGAGPARVELPWYALELLEGARDLVAHARAESLDDKARLRLFLQVGSAVAHAHQRGVIHRDLKAANILVDAAGRPKVIDFGVARAFDVGDGAASGASLHTQGGELLGTLRTMSPEQLDARAEPVDVRADVYALGAVLYELLLGRAPIELTGLSLVDAAAAVRERSPTPPRSIRPELARELEWILEKCLEKERERRYASVDALCADVAAFLDGRPVVAGPPSRAYRARKLVRRHLLAFSLAAFAFAALAGGLTATLLALRRAQDAEADRAAEAAAAREAERVADRRATEAQRAATQQRNLSEMLCYAADLAARDAGGAPVLMRDVLDRVAVAASQGHFVSTDVAGVMLTSLSQLFLSTGDIDRALECSDQALSRLESVGQGETGPAAFAWAIRAQIHVRRGEVDHALAAAERARAIDAGSLVSQSGAVYIEFSRAQALWESGRGMEALDAMWAAHVLSRVAAVENPDQTAVTSSSLASLLAEFGAAEDALSQAARALREEAQRHGERHRHTIAARIALAGACTVGGAPHAALALLDDAVPASASVDGPLDFRTLRARGLRAVAERAAGCPLDALYEQQRLLELRIEHLGPGHAQVLGAAREIASLLLELERPREALEAAELGLASASAELGADDARLASLRAAAGIARARAAGRALTAQELAALRDDARAAADALGPLSPRALEIATWIRAAGDEPVGAAACGAGSR